MSINKDTVAALIALTKPNDDADALQPTRPIVTRCTEQELIAAAVQCEPLRSLISATAASIGSDLLAAHRFEKREIDYGTVKRAEEAKHGACLLLAHTLMEAANA